MTLDPTQWAHRARVARGLSFSQWVTAAQVAVWVGGTRVALALLPWQRVERAFGRVPIRREVVDRSRLRTVLWALNAVPRRLLPRRPCLTQALVGQRLLRQCGLDPAFKIGVRMEDGELRAHAWLERDGVPIVGGADSTRKYAPLRPTVGDAG